MGVWGLPWIHPSEGSGTPPDHSALITRHRPALSGTLSTVHPPQPMLSRVLSRLSLSLAERAVLRYIRQNPGHQLFMINDATLRSHHSWGTKSVLSDLERHGKIYVRRFRPVRVKGDITVKKIKPLYYAADRYHG